MKNILFIITAMIAFSCNESPNTKQKNIDLKDSLSQKTENMERSEYVTYELIKDISIENVIKKYPPILNETFFLGKEGGIITEFRIGLLNIFKEEEIKNNNIKIKEITWETNDKENLTIWYQEKNNEWIPIDHFIWDKESEF